MKPVVTKRQFLVAASQHFLTSPCWLQTFRTLTMALISTLTGPRPWLSGRS